VCADAGGGAQTEDLPALAEPLAVLGVEDVEHGVAVGVVARPDRADAALAAEVHELQDRRRQRDLAHCAHGPRQRRRRRGERAGALFWPTVGAILFGGRPGVSL
jgi:hypothetical protein